MNAEKEPLTVDRGLSPFTDVAQLLLAQFEGELDWTTGDTKHEQTFNFFLRAAAAGISKRTAVLKLQEILSLHGAEINARDIVRQLDRAYAYIAGEQQPATRGTSVLLDHQPRPSLTFDRLLLAECTAHVPADNALDGFFRSKSVCWPSNYEQYLRGLYLPDETVLIGDGNIWSQPLLAWSPGGGPSRISVRSDKGLLFLSNPVDGQYRQVRRLVSPSNSSGTSCRSEESIVSFRYAVVEADHEDRDYPGFTTDWRKLLTVLPLPICSVVTSGRRSLHALVRLDATSKADWDQRVQELKEQLVPMGADRQSLTAVRLTRLPFAYRAGQEQKLLYFRPDADGTPMSDLTVDHGGAL
jgi:hypothetical protein